MKMVSCMKSIQVLAWRILKLFLILFCRLVQRHPLFSSIALIALFLRIFLPSIFFFSIYSSPFLFCATLFFLHYNRNSRKPHGKRDDHRDELVHNTDHNWSSETQPTWEKENEEMASGGVEEAMFDNEANFEKSSVWNGGGDAEFANSSTEEDDEKKDGEKNALEWTEDDQNNLNDVGISELERNRRLESLIARRRAKKSFNIKHKNSSIDINIPPAAPMAPLSVSRSNPFDAPDSAEVEIPHSAPSILLPNKNPFDIPYDPFEEKPDLTSDGFHQEFLAPLEREMHFCRHESFSFSTFALEQPQESQNTMLKGQPGKRDHDSLVEHLFSQGGETLRSKLTLIDLFPQSEPSKLTMKQQEGYEAIRTKSSISNGAPTIEATVENGSRVQVKMCSGASSSMKNNGSEGPENKQAGVPILEMFHNSIARSISCAFSKEEEANEPSYDSSPPMAERAVRIEEHLFHESKGNWHTPTHSMASDMQVEVSEVGSTPLTMEETASSNDGASLTYDGDVEKEITSDSDEMYGGSPDGPKIQHEQEPHDVIILPSFSTSSSRIDEHETRTDEDNFLGKIPSMNQSMAYDNEVIQYLNIC